MFMCSSNVFFSLNTPLRPRLHKYIFITKCTLIYPFISIIFRTIPETYTQNAYFQKRLPKWIEMKMPYSLCVKDKNLLAVSPFTWVSCDLKALFHIQQLKTEKCVAALLTILISLLAVYQLNCLLVVLNITFQHQRIFLARAMDSSLGAIRWSFRQQCWT